MLVAAAWLRYYGSMPGARNPADDIAGPNDAGSGANVDNILYGRLSPRERNQIEPERPGWWPIEGIRAENLYHSVVDAFHGVEGWSGTLAWMARVAPEISGSENTGLPEAWLPQRDDEHPATGAYGLRRDAARIIALVTDPSKYWASMHRCQIADEAEWDQVRLRSEVDSYIVDQHHLAAVTQLAGPELEWRVVSQINDPDAEYRNRHYLFCRRAGLEQPLGILDINVE